MTNDLLISIILPSHRLEHISNSNILLLRIKLVVIYQLTDLEWIPKERV